ncbi:MAG: hypothetical protein HC896_05000 [Bacteroidales bacterium]|nr:hypothetical protein [Bacteroidales bacterium]
MDANGCTLDTMINISDNDVKVDVTLRPSSCTPDENGFIELTINPADTITYRFRVASSDTIATIYSKLSGRFDSLPENTYVIQVRDSVNTSRSFDTTVILRNPYFSAVNLTPITCYGEPSAQLLLNTNLMLGSEITFR